MVGGGFFFFNSVQTTRTEIVTGNIYVSNVIGTFSEPGFLLFSHPPTMEEDNDSDEARSR